MDQIGYVVSIEGDVAVVDVRRTSACGDKCSSCGGGCNIPATRVNIENNLEARIGDFVEVRMETKTVMKSAFIAYVIPLIMLILGVGVGIYVFKSFGIKNYESFGFFVGLLFLGISYLILRMIDKKIRESNSLKLQMVRILDND